MNNETQMAGLLLLWLSVGHYRHKMMTSLLWRYKSNDSRTPYREYRDVKRNTQIIPDPFIHSLVSTTRISIHTSLATFPSQNRMTTERTTMLIVIIN